MTPADLDKLRERLVVLRSRVGNWIASRPDLEELRKGEDELFRLARLGQEAEAGMRLYTSPEHLEQAQTRRDYLIASFDPKPGDVELTVIVRYP